MKLHIRLSSLALLAFALSNLSHPAAAADLPPAVQAKVDAQMKAVVAWASDPVLVKAVKERNNTPLAGSSDLTEEKWKNLSVLDPLVRGLTKNEAALFLKSKQGGPVSKIFLSGADGTKVAFLAKTTSWSHKGTPKHEQPMSGKTWQGPMETDLSTGLRMVQIAVPVLDQGKPIGSLVVGLSGSLLEQ